MGLKFASSSGPMPPANVTTPAKLLRDSSSVVERRIRKPLRKACFFVAHDRMSVSSKRDPSFEEKPTEAPPAVNDSETWSAALGSFEVCVRPVFENRKRTSFTRLPKIELNVVSKLFSKFFESAPRDARFRLPMPLSFDVFSECEKRTVSAWFVLICQSTRGSKDARLCGRVTESASVTSCRLASRIVALIVSLFATFR